MAKTKSNGSNRRGTYHGYRGRGSIWTGLPGVPDKVRTNKMRVNKHDHSATCTKRATWYECAGRKTQMPDNCIRYVERN